MYGLAGSGLVLTYRTTGIFNFGYGAVATAAAYFFYSLHVVHGVPWIPAFLLAVVGGGVVMGLVIEQIARRLVTQPVATQIVGTVGLLLIVQGVATVAYGSTPIDVSQYLPGSFSHFRLAGVNISYPQLWVACIGATGAVLLYALINRTHIGLVMRAVVDDGELVSRQAVNPNRARRLSWIIGTTFSALSGVLILPFIGLDSIGLTFLVVQAFGAAAIGCFASLPLTFAGGIGLGVLADLSTNYVLNVPWLAGLPSSLPFLVLIVVLLVTPKRKLMRASKTAPRPQVRYHAPGRVRLVTGAGVLAALLVLPQIVGAARLDFYTVGLSQVIMILSLGLLVRTSGQVSICHSVFAAIGAVAFSQFAVGLGLPWLVALVLGGLVVVPVGALVALPAIRLSGIYLALATFGFGILVERLLYAREWFFTSFDSGRRMPRPSFAATDHSYYYVVLAIAVLTAVSIVVIHQTRLGRSLQGLADAPVAVTALGLSSSVTRVVVFAISAFMAGEAGVLYGCTVHFAIGTDSHYTSFYSLVLLATLAIAPFGEPWYGVMGGIAAVVPAYVTGINTQDWLNVVFGLLAVDVSVRGYQQMPVWMRRVIDRLGRRRIGPEPRASISGAPARSVVTRGEQDDGGLTVSDLSVRFGGVAAVDSVSFHAPFAQITGLIGPNGAGKTTTFDACSGLNRPREGTITLGGKDITRLGPAARARLGLGRTFQQIQLGESMTVFENVVLGREASFAGSGVRSQLLATRAERRTTQDATLAALELCGIGNLATSRTGALSTGQRRLVELARCLAGPFDMLLLDEPSSGLDRHETAEMERVLQMVVHERRCGILLVEHDMSLVLNICERVHVMDSGRLIFSGTKEEVSASPVVRAAYLGDQSSVLTRSMTT